MTGSTDRTESGWRTALRNSLVGWGAMTWISPRRRRVAKLVFPVSGFFIGVLVMRMLDVLPDGTWNAELMAYAIGILVVLTISYVTVDVVVGMEMLDKRVVEIDLAIARQIQRRALPVSLPELPGWELAAHHESARAIGGDAYDAFTLEDGRLLVAIADVSGKGVSAALLMMGVLARLRALARMDLGLAELVVRINEAMVAETETTHFSTLVVAVLDPASGRLEYVNAGNTPPLLVRADGSYATLKQGGLPTGMLPDLHYTAGVVTLGIDDRLLLMTDGVTDADEEGAVLLNDPALAELAGGAQPRSATEIVLRIRDTIATHRGDNRFDDVTILALVRTGSA